MIASSFWLAVKPITLWSRPSLAVGSIARTSSTTLQQQAASVLSHSSTQPPVKETVHYHNDTDTQDQQPVVFIPCSSLLAPGEVLEFRYTLYRGEAYTYNDIVRFRRSQPRN